MKITRKKIKVPVTIFKTVSTVEVKLTEREAVLIRDVIGGSSTSALVDCALKGFNRGNFTESEAQSMLQKIVDSLNEVFPDTNEVFSNNS